MVRAFHPRDCSLTCYFKVEVRLKSASKIRVDLIRRLVHSHLESEYETLLTHSNVSDWQDVAALSANIDRIWIGECSDADSSPAVPLSEVNPVIHVYQPTTRGDAVSEFSTSSPADEDEQDGDVPAASVLALPASSLDGLWDSLIYEDDVKQRLLSYIHSTMLFSDASIDFNIVTWNRHVPVSPVIRDVLTVNGQSRAVAWATRNRQDVAVSSAGTKASHQVIASVRIRKARRDQFAFPLFEMVLRVGQTRTTTVSKYQRARRRRRMLCRRPNVRFAIRNATRFANGANRGAETKWKV